jgi:hypothetical protein
MTARAETQRKRRGHNFWAPADLAAPVPAIYGSVATDARDKTIWLHYSSAAATGGWAEVDPTRASVQRMAQRALSPNGGRATHVGLRIAPEDFVLLEQAAERRGVDRSHFVREALAKAIAEELRCQEVSAEAS